MVTAVIVPNWVRDQMLAVPESSYCWDFGVDPRGTRRAKALLRRFKIAEINATLRRDNTYAPGLWKLEFPIKDYRKAAAIADACYVGESWWPTKGKR